MTTTLTIDNGATATTFASVTSITTTMTAANGNDDDYENSDNDADTTPAIDDIKIAIDALTTMGIPHEVLLDVNGESTEVIVPNNGVTTVVNYLGIKEDNNEEVETPPPPPPILSGGGDEMKKEKMDSTLLVTTTVVLERPPLFNENNNNNGGGIAAVDINTPATATRLRYMYG
jgi:uncharacterized UBP type Zn finger protein